MEGQGKSKAKAAKAAKGGSGKAIVQKAEGKALRTELKAFEYEYETPVGKRRISAVHGPRHTIRLLLRKAGMSGGRLPASSARICRRTSEARTHAANSPC